MKRKTSKKKTIKKVRAVIYDKKDGELYFLILHRILRWKGWEALKETAEKREAPEDTLRRGIKEETGLKKFRIIASLKKQEKWISLNNHYAIVDTFLVRADMKQKISLKQEIIEHDKYEWVKREAAIKRLTWPKTKELFRQLEINGRKK